MGTHPAFAALPALVLIASIGSGGAGAQQPPSTPRPIGRVVATSREVLANVSSVVEMRDGRLLANDPNGHRVVLFDTTLATFITVADTTSGTAKAYGSRAGGLLSYLGDTTLFVDPTSTSFLLITPEGRLGRVMAIPRASDVNYLTTPVYGAGFDDAGRLVYRRTPTSAPPPPPLAGGTSRMVPAADSIPLLRVELTTRKVDTVGSLKAPSTQILYSSCGDGCFRVTSINNPLAGGDDWALLPDGTIAIIRSFDYHVDWINRDGSRSSSPKVEHAWVRLTDSAKAALIDSVKRHDDSVTTARLKAASVSAASPAGAGQAAQAAAKGAAAAAGPGAAYAPQYIDPSDLPDYRPPFVSQSARADLDGNIWIRTNVPATTVGAIYDVINRQGALVDRVQLPGGCTLVGFGRGTIYITSKDGTGIRLARAKVR